MLLSAASVCFAAGLVAASTLHYLLLQEQLDLLRTALLVGLTLCALLGGWRALSGLRAALRRTLGLLPLLGALAVHAPAAPSSAEPRPWIGTLEVVLPGIAKVEVDRGGGVAQIGSILGQIESLALAGGLAGSTILPITDPLVSAGGLQSIRITASLGSGELRIDPVGYLAGPILTVGTLPLPGELRLCLYSPGCGFALSMPLTESPSAGLAGIGAGGLLTVGGLGSIRVSVLGAPWTINTATLTVQTPQGGETFLSSVGFVHGPLSLTSSGAATLGGEGGAMQMVTPIRVQMLPGVAGRNALGGFARLTLRFVPEPSVLLVLGGRDRLPGRDRPASSTTRLNRSWRSRPCERFSILASLEPWPWSSCSRC
jgi:hypothetical protein